MLWYITRLKIYSTLKPLARDGPLSRWTFLNSRSCLKVLLYSMIPHTLDMLSNKQLHDFIYILFTTLAFLNLIFWYKIAIYTKISQNPNQSLRKIPLQLLVHKSILLKGLDTVHSVLPQVLHNLKDWNLLQSLRTSQWINHRPQSTCSPNTCTAVDQKHFVSIDQAETFFNKASEKSFGFLTERLF